MKGSSNIISAIIDLKKADEHLQSFIREYPGSKGAKLFDNYSGKIHWIFRDILTHPFLTREVIEGVRREINSDVFAVDAIAEKAALLTPDQRDFIERIIEGILSGEEIKMEMI